MKNIDEQLQIICRGASEVIQKDELIERIKSKKKLIVKAGLDPTMPDMHLGHTVVLNKLRQFQDLGHEVVFLIGDYTASIGDPSGRDITRPATDPKDIKKNSKIYEKEIYKILDKKKTRIEFNSTWLGKLTGADLIKLASSQTVARMLERDDFEKRYKSEQAISIHEFLYPLLQAYDSVHLEADVELGGTDQKFNLLLGRKLQEQKQLKPQICLTMPILEGLDGIKKMSKSYNNFISISDEPNDMFGKIMSISDDLMWKYFKLLSLMPIDKVNNYKEKTSSGEMNPRDVKLELASEIVNRFYDKDAGRECSDNFINRFTNKKITSDIPELIIKKSKDLPNIDIITLLTKQSNIITSTSEVRRLIKQKAIKIDDIVIDSFDQLCPLGKKFILHVGKKITYKIEIK